MSIIRHAINAFIGGEISPYMAGRVDTEQYAVGLALCENFVPINEGPLVKRPGFEFIRDADASAAWLTAFRFSTTQEYVIEWGEEKARFFTNGVRIETAPNAPYEVVTPYVAADVPQLSTQQSYDRLYIDHGSYPPARLSRTSATTFAYEVSALTGGPFIDQNIVESITVTASGSTGSVTLTASADIWATTDIGAFFRIEASDFSDIKAWQPGMQTISIGEVVRSDGKAYQAATGGKTGTVQPIHSSGSEWDGQTKNDVATNNGPYGVRWTYLHDRFGVVRITGFTAADEVTADVIRRLPSSLTSVPSWRWAHGSFSTTRGWPSLVAHWGGRQVHIKQFDVHASVVGDYLNHSTLTPAGQVAPDMAFRRTLAASNPPLWLAVDRKQLILGTSADELVLSPTNPAAIVSGDNISADPQSFYGSERVFPAQVGTQTMFIERGGYRIRAAGYDFARDRYAAVDLTAAARHITGGGIVQLAYQRVPYALLYGVRSDGQLIVHPDTRLELKGFSRTVLGGQARALSAVSVVGADGRTDELFVLVSRETPLGTRREIWRQTPWRDLGASAAASFFVDGGVTVTAAGGQTHFSGAVHLAGQAVAVLANGGVVEGVTVDNSGAFDLPATSVPATPYTLVVGLAYTARAVTLRPAGQVNGQSLQALRQRVTKIVLRLLESIGIRAGGFVSKGEAAPTDEMIDRPGNAPMDAAIPLFTGDADALVDAEFDTNGQTTFVSDRPLPAVITMAMLNLDVSAADV